MSFNITVINTAHLSSLELKKKKIAGPSVKELSRQNMATKFYKALKNHRILELSGLERALNIISFQTCAVGRHTFHYTKLLRSPSNLALSSSR